MNRVRRDESGAVLLIMVISLVVLLGMAALVVDLGGSYSQRRKMQSASDSAAVGAAQNLAASDLAGSVAQATTIGNENLPKRTLDWNACGIDVLPTSPLKFTAYPGSNCISFSSDFRRIRVRIPRQTFPTLFGRVLGISTTGTSTIAIAKVQGVGTGGGLEPFAIDNAFGSGDYCLDSGGTGNSLAPCDGATTGNFGVLDFATCGAVNQSLDDDIAAGADHFYTSNPTGLLADISDDCSQPGPNTVAPETGNKVGQETPGLLTGFGPFADGGPARLQRVPKDCSQFSPAWEAVSAPCGSQSAIDNRPLWEFIPYGLTGVPASCLRETFDTLLAATPPAQQQLVMHNQLTTCINDYVASGSSVPVFSADTGNVVDQGLPLYDIQSSPRFVYVPQMRELVPFTGQGQGPYHIMRFRAVFIQRTGANNSPSFFEPGPWNGTTLPDTSAAYTAALVLPAPRAGCTPTPTDSCGTMLPGTLGSIDTVPVVIGANAVIELVG